MLWKVCGNFSLLHVGWWSIVVNGWSSTIKDGEFLGWVFLIPCCGHFMCPLAVARLGFRYLRISFLDMLGHPLRNPFCTAFNNVEIFGLHNNWCANFTSFPQVCTECVRDARVTLGCITGRLSCGAQSTTKADCGREVLILLHPLIGRVRKSVDGSLQLHKITYPLNITLQ